MFRNKESAAYFQAALNNKEVQQTIQKYLDKNSNKISETLHKQDAYCKLIKDLKEVKDVRDPALRYAKIFFTRHIF